MNLYVTLKIICDLCFYFTFANFIGGFWGAESLLFYLPLFGLSVYMSSFLASRKYLKFFPVLLLFLTFFLMDFRIADFFVILPAWIYAAYSVNSMPINIMGLDYSRVFSSFLYSFVPLILAGLVISSGNLVSLALPLGLVFLAGSIILMRTLRHDEDTIKQPKFKMLNALSVLAVVIFVFAISSAPFLNLCKAVVSFIYSTLVAPLLLLAATGLAYVFLLIFPSFGKVWKYDADNEFKPSEGPGMNLFDEIEPALGISYYVFYGVLILAAASLILYITVRLFSFLSQNGYLSKKSTTITEERMSIGSPKPKKKLRNSSQNRIRSIYARFMRLCLSRGISLKPGMTTEDIARVSGYVFKDPKSAARLRDIYILTRYAGAAAAKTDIKECKGIYSRFKKQT